MTTVKTLIEAIRKNWICKLCGGILIDKGPLYSVRWFKCSHCGDETQTETL